MNERAVNSEIRYKANEYRQRNRQAIAGGCVFFGSDTLAAFPVTELAQNLQIEKVYNRSISGLSLNVAADVLEDCLVDLCPEKIFLCFGDEEKKTQVPADGFEEEYRWLLYCIHNYTHARLYIIYPIGDGMNDFRDILRRLCEETGCTGVDTADLQGSDLYLQLFDRLRFHLRGHLSFAQAINY